MGKVTDEKVVSIRPGTDPDEILERAKGQFDKVLWGLERQKMLVLMGEDES